MRQLHTSAAVAALMLSASPFICCADDGSGGQGGGGGQKPPEETKPPETKPEAKEKPAKAVHVIWAAPGHESFSIGGMLKTSPEMAEALRAAGRARLASREEVEAATKAKAEIRDFG